MNAIFVNGSYGVEACGVYQYGTSLYSILKDSTQINWHYIEPQSLETLKKIYSPSDIIVYNWQSGQGGFLLDAPFDCFGKQVLIFHDCLVNDRFDAILFSDPTMPAHDKWHPIGRPLPQYIPSGEKLGDDWQHPVIGVHGFIGAWADQVVHRVLKEFEYATIRLSLPSAVYGDSEGQAARNMAARCQYMVNDSSIKLDVSHAFMPKQDLIEWLHANDLNCYIRPTDVNWRGVSSAPDLALAARRPMAINKSNAFRHLHKLSPSICVEDNSLMDIIGNGLAPLVPLRSKWSPEQIRKEVEDVVMSL